MEDASDEEQLLVQASKLSLHKTADSAQPATKVKIIAKSILLILYQSLKVKNRDTYGSAPVVAKLPFG